VRSLLAVVLRYRGYSVGLDRSDPSVGAIGRKCDIVVESIQGRCKPLRAAGYDERHGGWSKGKGESSSLTVEDVDNARPQTIFGDPSFLHIQPSTTTQTLAAAHEFCRVDCVACNMQSFSSASSTDPPFLQLPVELRRLIYRLILPHTTTFAMRYQQPPTLPAKAQHQLTFVRQPTGAGIWKMQTTAPKSDRETGNDVVWRRGCTQLLAVNRQVHEEAADMLYGDNTFVIDVAFDKIAFRYRWRTENGLTPSREYLFLDHFSQRNLLRVKNYVVNVEFVDDYTGMIKYNCGGRGLAAGIRARVRELVDLVAAVPQLHRLQVHLIDGAVSRVRFPSGRVHRVQDESIYAQTQTVLEPFRALYGVRQVQITGVNEEYGEALMINMKAQRGALHV
jgi:hypothetical protein